MKQFFTSDKVEDFGPLFVNMQYKGAMIDEQRIRHQLGQTHDIKLRVARNLKETKPVEQRAKEWIEAHPEIYTEFCRFAWQAVNAGCTKISADMVAHQVRWFGMIERKGKGFVVNNNAVSAMAKRFVTENPVCEGLFEFRGKV